jgi:hypothetical protein
MNNRYLYPSLQHFHLLLSSSVISFVYLSIYLVRITSGKSDALTVDNNLQILLGMSIDFPLVSNLIYGLNKQGRVPEMVAVIMRMITIQIQGQ